MTATAADEAMFTIGQMAAKHDVSLRTLRFYEEKGLLEPYRDGKTRFYSHRDDSLIQHMVSWRRAGFAMTQVADLRAAYLGKPSQEFQYLLKRACVDRREDLMTELEAVAAIEASL